MPLWVHPRTVHLPAVDKTAIKKQRLGLLKIESLPVELMDKKQNLLVIYLAFL